MWTLNIIIICLTIFLTTMGVIIASICNNYGLKKAELTHKKEMEE